MTENPSSDTPEQSSPASAPPPPRRHGRDLTTGSIPRHLIIFSLPMLVGGAFQTAYSFINRYWVGKFLGSDPLAAVTLSIPVVFVLMALGAGLTMATSILISQHYGARDMPAVKRVVDSSTLLVGGLSLALLVAGEVLAPAILRAMNTPPDVLPLAVDYLRIFLLSMPLGFGLFLTRSMLQGIGDSTTPLYFLGVSVALNAALDPVLMFGWLGLPVLGLNGTAWATLISQGLAIVALVAWLRRRKNPVAPELDWRCFDWATAWTTIRIGMPTAVQHALISVGMAFVTGIINGFGKLATAAFGAASCIDGIAFLPALTFSMAISTLAGQNIGAGRHDRIRQIVLWGCLLSGGITLTASALVVSIPRLLLSIFTNDAAVIDIGAGYLRIVGSCYIFFAIMFVTNGIINGSGHTLVTTLISLISLWVIRVPVADWLSRRMHSIDGVWYAMAGSFGVSMVVSFAYYLTGHWRRPVARRPAIPPGAEATFDEETAEM
jgi:putative MATE family efflux protein